MQDLNDWELKHLEELDRKFLRNSAAMHDEAGYAAQMEVNIVTARRKADATFDFIDRDLG